MNQIANSLILAFQQAAGVSHHLLEITGLNGHFHSAADTLYAYPATTTTFRLVHFTTVVFKIRTSEGKNLQIIYFSQCFLMQREVLEYRAHFYGNW